MSGLSLDRVHVVAALFLISGFLLGLAVAHVRAIYWRRQAEAWEKIANRYKAFALEGVAINYALVNLYREAAQRRLSGSRPHQPTVGDA